MPEQFNYSLYDKLLLEDREIIDEYIPRMPVDVINSFMLRFISRYEIEKNKETSKKVDSIVVFENVKNPLIVSSAKVKKNILISEVKLWIDKFINNQIFDEKILFATKKYFMLFWHDFSIKNNYIQVSQHDVDKISYTKIINNIYEIYVKENKKSIYEVNVKTLINNYTYRNSMTRLGIVIDKNIIMSGYGKNYKINKKMIKIYKGSINISCFIKSAGYWSPKNAIKHNFDNKTGIIWLNAKHVNEDTWKFPDHSYIKNNTPVSVQFCYTTDAFTKKLERIGLNKTIKKLLNALKKHIATKEK